MPMPMHYMDSYISSFVSHIKHKEMLITLIYFSHPTKTVSHVVFHEINLSKFTRYVFFNFVYTICKSKFRDPVSLLLATLLRRLFGESNVDGYELRRPIATRWGRKSSQGLGRQSSPLISFLYCFVCCLSCLEEMRSSFSLFFIVSLRC